ncbi:MAG: hypothetical protein JW748_11690 [Anaerolineales bacterium]|nr:hypothetical protein [Anaerolineales bacterium]
MRIKPVLWPGLLLASLLFSGCQAQTTATGAAAAPPGNSAEPVPSPTAETNSSTETPEDLAPAGPQEITFLASDGQELHGRYYPASASPAPVVVLMHWVNGDMTDWNEIAPWLQNTGYDNTYPNCQDESGKWWDPSWFPAVPAGKSYGVFLFTFRDHKPCERSSEWKPAEWLLDAQAALKKASELEGADPKRIVAMGSSIGADAAVDACAWWNKQVPDSCQGALSLSPGGFLDVPYADAVKDLGEGDNPRAAWCLADPSEISICKTVPESANAKYRMVEIANGHHGNLLLVPESEPSTLQVILDFLMEVLG